MIPHIFGLTLIGSMRPYFRKHVLNTLESREFLFVNAFFISLAMATYFIYVYFFEKHVIQRAYKNCCRLSWTQAGALILLAIFTVCSSFLIIDLDKRFNTPFLNYIIIKAISMIALLLVGIFLFEENYDAKTMTGILLTASGIIILTVFTDKE